jgi:hypothetical protein
MALGVARSRSGSRSSTRRLGSLGGLCLVLACQGVLGIEDLQEGPRPSAAGGGSAGSGDVSVAGSSGAGGSSAGAGTSSAGSSGVAGSVSAGAGGDAGTPEPLPDGGTPDGGGVGDGIVVAGRVVDFFRRAVPETVVTIGTATAVTDAQGAFSISGVEAPYTASLVINMIRGGGQARYAYVYEGLTRADPTLQVYSALSERSSSSISVTFDNITFDGPYAILAFGSPDGRFVDEETTNDTEFLGSPAWTGPTTISGNIHALSAFKDVSDEPPVTYEAYQTFPLAVTDNLAASVAFDLTPTSLTVGTLDGSVSGGVADFRTNFAGLRFSDGTAMPLVDFTPDLPDFLYFVPSLEGASFFLAAADGSSGFPPYAVTHQENIAFDATGLALAIPRAVTLTSPENAGAVTPSTPYVWSPLSQTAQTFLWHLESDGTYEGIFVLTSRTQIELPQIDGLTISPGLAVTWSVETHGDAPDVDALTGPDGFLDAYSLGSSFPIGPNRSDGYYTESERRGFVMGSD